MRYYLLVNALGGPLFPLLIIPAYIRYKTLRYRFDEDGVSTSWGWVFRKETYLAYRRIQDIHVTRNLVHRWLGLSEVAIQTAAGSTTAEMKIEGIRDPEGVRDYLYSKMRGVREGHGAAPSEISNLKSPVAGSSHTEGSGATSDELLSLLTEIRDELRKRNGRSS
jgi:putative membrane protein